MTRTSESSDALPQIGSGEHDGLVIAAPLPYAEHPGIARQAAERRGPMGSA